MWIVANESFLSIVECKDDPSMLLVRARVEGDIERAFPDARVKITPRADYLYRAFIPRGEVASTIEEMVQGIDYLNFKNSVKDRVRHDAYLDVWRVMERVQA
jgi:hypothetical protein